MKFSTVLLALSGSAYAQSAICSQGIYKTLVPLLKSYVPAQKYCALKYPVAGTVVTVTKPPTVLTTTAVVDQLVTTTVALRKKRTNSLDPRDPSLLQERGLEEEWQKCLKQAVQVVKTFCGCIQDPKVATVTVTPSTLVTVTSTRVVIVTMTQAAAPRACPESTRTFNLQSSSNGLFAVTAPGSVSGATGIQFSATTASSGEAFFFTSSCQLSVRGASSGVSVTVDTRGNFAISHFFYLAQPDGTPGSDQNVITCTADVGVGVGVAPLSCSVRDQNVLQLSGTDLVIQSAAVGAGSIFTALMSNSRLADALALSNLAVPLLTGKRVRRLQVSLRACGLKDQVQTFDPRLILGQAQLYREQMMFYND
ncbi:hypothetical protein OPT61_g4449 [Boeremia exigua]|uniref:Uncharacterized protein n=1 Tax=Boeremia exigua TaxID=749465 RepID=A0ACC2IDZ8_9PLEO|nr:hypothetical protein OPT61_g4449 [Boeremia exigua]